MRRSNAILCGAMLAAICSTAALAVDSAVTGQTTAVTSSQPTDGQLKPLVPPTAAKPATPARTAAPAKPIPAARFAPQAKAPAAQKPTAPAKPSIVARPPLPSAPRPRQSFADMVRELVAKGEVRPLKDVLDVVHKTSPGEIVSVKLRHQRPRWVYHVRVMHDGRRTDLDVDGMSLKVLERK